MAIKLTPSQFEQARTQLKAGQADFEKFFEKKGTDIFLKDEFANVLKTATVKPETEKPETPFVKTPDSSAIFDIRGEKPKQFLKPEEFYKSASDYFGRPISSFEKGTFREVEKSPVGISRNVEEENKAIKQFGRQIKTQEELEKVLIYAYGDKIPDEFKQFVDADSFDNPLDRNPLTGENILNIPTDPSVEGGIGIDELKQGVEAGQERLNQFNQPNSALNILQGALRTKARTAQQSLGESAIFKAAGVTGFGALDQSLAARQTELQSNLATFKNQAQIAAGEYGDAMRSASRDYENSVKLYETEANRLTTIDRDLKNHQRALEILNKQYENNISLQAYKNKYSLITGEDAFGVLNEETGTVKIITGQTRAQRNNNPLNIKSSNFTKTFEGISGIDDMPVVDGGNFLQFKTPEQGFIAGIKLLKEGKPYQNKTVDEAMKIWSNNGYTGSIIPHLKNKKVSDLSSSELDILTKAMALQEGFYEETQNLIKPKATGRKNVVVGNTEITQDEYNQALSIFGNDIKKATPTQIIDAAKNKIKYIPVKEPIMTPLAGVEPTKITTGFITEQQAISIDLEAISRGFEEMEMEKETGEGEKETGENKFRKIRQGFMSKYGEGSAKKFDDFFKLQAQELGIIF